MKIISPTLFFALALYSTLYSSMAAALERAFPPNSVQVKIEAISDPYLVVSSNVGGRRYVMPPGMLIFSANNMTIVRGALSSGVMARIQLDLNGDLRRIWILNPEEVVTTSKPSTPIGPTEKVQ